jgi:putative transposase
LLAVRGIIVSYETMLRWCLTFGHLFAAALRRRRPPPRDRWHLDEMHLRIGGNTYNVWRAVDADGMVLDVFLQERRNQGATETFLRRLLEEQPAEPRVVVTDKLAAVASSSSAPLTRRRIAWYARANTKRSGCFCPPHRNGKSSR